MFYRLLVLAHPHYIEAARQMARTISDEIGAQAARHELEALASPTARPTVSDAADGIVSAEG